MSNGKPERTTLIGGLIRLEPLTAAHVAPLMAIARAFPDEYRLTSTPVTADQERAYFAKALADAGAGTAYPYAIVRLIDDAIVGSTRLTEIHWQHRRCELGFTWLHPDVLGSGVNVESKYLLLKLAFETLELIRVQIHTDIRNVRSQRAIRALGAAYEGVLRRHMITKDGYIRDTMVFSVVDRDWPEVEARLRARLAAHGSVPPETSGRS